MQATKKITRLSNGLYWLTSMLLVAIPVIVSVILWQDWVNPGQVLGRYPDLPEQTRLTATKLGMLALIGIIGTLPVWVTFWNMRGLFGHYRSGDIVGADCAHHILRIGWAMLAMALWGVLGRTLQILALTHDNADGGKILTIGIEGSSLGLLLAGGLLITIGWVMGEAAREIESFI